MDHLYIPGYTLRESDVLIGQSYGYTRKNIARGRITATKDIFGQWRVPFWSLVAFVEKRENTAKK